MRISAALLLALLALPALAQTRASGDLHILESSNVVERAWTRSLVTVDQHGTLHGGAGKVGSLAAVSAADAAIEYVGEVAVEAKAAVTNSMAPVYAATNSMARNALGLAFHIAPQPPEGETNLVAYLVKTETSADGSVDTQYVWYSQELSAPPARYVEYVCYAERTTVPAVWQTPFSNTVAVTRGGMTWEGCHVCTVQRPLFARDFVCLDDRPNEPFGGASGFDIGSMSVFVGGVPAFTGFITNKLDSTKWIRVDNGFVKEVSW